MAFLVPPEERLFHFFSRRAQKHVQFVHQRLQFGNVFVSWEIVEYVLRFLLMWLAQ